MRVSASHQTEFPTSCEREELPYKTWFNYYKGDGSYTYDLKVEYVGSTCKQLSGMYVFILFWYSGRDHLNRDSV